MSESLEQGIAQRVRGLFKDGVTLRCQRGTNGLEEPPVVCKMMMQLEFSIPQLREYGFRLTILNADGRELSDDEYAAMLEAADRRRAESYNASNE